MNDEGWFEAFNESFVLDNQVPAANDSFVSQNQQIDTDSDNYITEEEEEAANERDSIESPPFSPISCASDDEPVEQQVISEEHVEEHESSNAVDEDNANQTQWNGFIIVIDNLDKNIHRSFQRIDFQTRSLHICNAYAVKDRVNFSGYSDRQTSDYVVDLKQLLPSTLDLNNLKDDFQILISR